ncbi:Uncharacterised protein [Mycobacterium tuberculosis]|nr:Uncharacterised protein [Mycobacterium tuberculosis]
MPSSASRSAARNSGVPGLAFLSATGTALSSTVSASAAWPANWLRDPGP